jgi:hypothetical protein
MPLICLPSPPSCWSLVARLRSLEKKRPCPRRVELLVLRLGNGFDVSASSWDDPEQPPNNPFLPLNSPRWRSPMSEGDAALAFEDWATTGYLR